MYLKTVNTGGSVKIMGEENFLPKLETETLTPLTFSENIESTNKKGIVCIKCLKCQKYYVFPDDKDDYLAHLFLEHRLVIADVDDIALLEDYLIYWQNEFEGHDLENYCTTMLLDQMPDGTPAKNEKYYLLSDILPKDYELRKQLWRQRLEKVLAQHQFEITDRNFSKECLYCRDVIRGLRAQYLEHLFTKHFLQLGKPENLVFVDELLAKVQSNLENLICLFCEKTFKDRITLKEHMRKKGHKRINPNNHMYDKYFLVHYRTENSNRKPQLKKNGFKNRDQQRRNLRIENNNRQTDASDRSERDSVSEFEQRFGRQDDDDNDSDWSDWNCEQQPALNCLFCSQQEVDFSILKAHLLKEHQLDFDGQVAGLSFYQKIKMINYVRRQMRLLRCVNCDLRFDNLDLLLEHMASEMHFTLGTRKQWDKPEYFFPTYEDDGLLCVLDDNLNEDNSEDTSVQVISEDSIAQINKDAERLSLENFNFSEIGI